MKVPLKFKYANQKAKEIYESNGGLKYESAGAAGFDLRACEFDILQCKDYDLIEAEENGDKSIFQATNKNMAKNFVILTPTKIPNKAFLMPQARILVKTGLYVELPKIEKSIPTILEKSTYCQNSTIARVDYFDVGKENISITYELQIRPRSGLALKHGITVLNSPGTIDADYRGEIGVILYNAGHEPFEIKLGDRIAQAVLAEVPQADFIEVEELDETKRGEGGFGSTGK